MHTVCVKGYAYEREALIELHSIGCCYFCSGSFLQFLAQHATHRLFMEMLDVINENDVLIVAKSLRFLLTVSVGWVDVWMTAV